MAGPPISVIMTKWIDCRNVSFYNSDGAAIIYFTEAHKGCFLILQVVIDFFVFHIVDFINFCFFFNLVSIA